jgi:hypothetical protein
LRITISKAGKKKLEPICRPWTLGQGLVATSWRCSYYFFNKLFSLKKEFINTKKQTSRFKKRRQGLHRSPVKKLEPLFINTQNKPVVSRNGGKGFTEVR